MAGRAPLTLIARRRYLYNGYTGQVDCHTVQFLFDADPACFHPSLTSVYKRVTASRSASPATAFTRTVNPVLTFVGVPTVSAVSSISAAVLVICLGPKFTQFPVDPPHLPAAKRDYSGLYRPARHLELPMLAEQAYLAGRLLLLTAPG